MDKITVEIPEGYLLHIATHGDMGSGEFSTLMKTWAEKECAKHGLGERLKAMQLEKITVLRDRIRNVLGDEAMEYIDEGIGTAKVALGIANQMRGDKHEDNAGERNYQ